MYRILINSSKNIESAINDFISHKNAQGLTESTIKCYKSHLHIISQYLDYQIALSDLRQDDIQGMIAKMREKGLAQNSMADGIVRNRQY